MSMTPSAQAHAAEDLLDLVLLCACANIGVTVDGKAWLSAVDSTIELACTGVAHMPQGQGSPLWPHPQWAAAWPLVPRSRTLERPTSGPSDLFQPYVTQMTG